MIKKKIAGFLFLLSFVCCLSSCEVHDEYEAREEATYALCMNAWEDTFENNDGYDCLQLIEFFPDGTGMDSYTTFYPNGREKYEEVPFFWDWDNPYFDALYIDYPDQEDSYMEEIRIGNRRLRCVLDDDDVEFKAVP